MRARIIPFCREEINLHFEWKLWSKCFRSSTEIRSQDQSLSARRLAKMRIAQMLEGLWPVRASLTRCELRRFRIRFVKKCQNRERLRTVEVRKKTSNNRKKACLLNRLACLEREKQRRRQRRAKILSATSKSQASRTVIAKADPAAATHPVSPTSLPI